jgi:hypothetical protein
MQVKGPGDVSVTCETCEDFASLILYFQMLPSEKNNVVGVDFIVWWAIVIHSDSKLDDYEASECHLVVRFIAFDEFERMPPIWALSEWIALRYVHSWCAYIPT